MKTSSFVLKIIMKALKFLPFKANLLGYFVCMELPQDAAQI
jgi:hypothetical protein